MAIDAYNTVRQCATCARNRFKLRKHASTLKLFPARAPLEYVAIDLLGELIKTPRGNRYLLVMTDRYSKFTRVVPLRNITADTVAKTFVRHWVMAYGTPSWVLIDNGTQFAGKFFADKCRIFGAKNVFTTTYHPQCNGQVERYNSTIVKAMRQYIADHPREWDLYAEPVTYAYNCQPHLTTRIAPFELILSNPPGPPGILPEPTATAVPPAELRLTWKSRLSHLMHSADEAISSAQKRYKRNFDNRIRPMRLALWAGSIAFLRADRPTKTDGHAHKLAPLVTGLHRIEDVAEDGRTLILRLCDRLERVSRDRVVPAPSPPTAEWTVAEAPTRPHHTLWPVPAGFNLAQFPPKDGTLQPLNGMLPRFATEPPNPASRNRDASRQQHTRPTESCNGETTDAATSARHSNAQLRPSWAHADADTTTVPPQAELNTAPCPIVPSHTQPIGDRLELNGAATFQSPASSPGTPRLPSSVSYPVQLNRSNVQTMDETISVDPLPTPMDTPVPRAAQSHLPTSSLSAADGESSTNASAILRPGRATSPAPPPHPYPDADLPINQPTSAEYAIDRIIAHETADGSEEAMPAGEMFYLIRWFGYEAQDDT